MPLIIRSDTPGWIIRAHRLILAELKIDICKMPTKDLTEVLLAAIDNEKADTFRAEVLKAARRVVERKYLSSSGFKE